MALSSRRRRPRVTGLRHYGFRQRGGGGARVPPGHLRRRHQPPRRRRASRRGPMEPCSRRQRDAGTQEGARRSGPLGRADGLDTPLQRMHRIGVHAGPRSRRPRGRCPLHCAMECRTSVERASTCGPSVRHLLAPGLGSPRPVHHHHPLLLPFDHGAPLIVGHAGGPSSTTAARSPARRHSGGLQVHPPTWGWAGRRYDGGGPGAISNGATFPIKWYPIPTIWCRTLHTLTLEKKNLQIRSKWSPKTIRLILPKENTAIFFKEISMYFVIWR